MNIKCAFLFSIKLLSETFPILRRIQRDLIIHVYVFYVTQSTRYSCQILIKLEFSR
jgi:hypothetical protein